MYEDESGWDEDTRRRQQRDNPYEAPPPAQTGRPGNGPWALDYDPGPNWNDGQKPNQDDMWSMTTNQWIPQSQDPSPQSGNGTVGPAASLIPQPTAPAPQAPAFQPPAQAAPSSYTPWTTQGQQAPSAPAAATKTPPITDEVTKILMQRLNELKTPGDLNSDPIYQQALRANQMGLMRSADKQRKALAERSAASGTRSSGGFNVGVRGIQERVGEQGAQYAAGLGLDRLQARESQLVEAIRLARSVGQDDIANQLEVQRLQLQSELGRGDLALRGELGRANVGLGYDNLGLGYANLLQSGNRDAVMAGLRG